MKNGSPNCNDKNDPDNYNKDLIFYSNINGKFNMIVYEAIAMLTFFIRRM